ncbi:30S ribosomal protein S4 [Mycoplasmopsis arginini]|uniref:Small ribosomal subunit protein uS4 n=1 Tax=Mycoplasmopsis arginini TaxID=2094 RepID=A0AA43QX86_MYCAR|nr:30S ribosomal protein S4 [Mycoplasmopsis arginini]MCY2903003.1 30S ribosomal protein S4 [Mycoplasmopsis arginini QMP CG1-2758]MDI3349128.1 30S ribosomal protein S4 [Mycoplasmopsis arginini]MDI3349850.1 30S ribosomal protein S4 [Mycoplasmopsis arginini]MDI3350420.1 30S ribosomal protein S4 [Mycoplasmopsis arginini]MDI3350997.1 30S ribosomal protein S4 [Mycoplasmopsis arginini]
MSRFLGSIFKKSRRYGTSLLENNKEFTKGKKRTTAPGQHGAKRSKPSDYQLHMYEKQKVRFMYGLNERQFKNLFNVAAKKDGVTGTNLLQLVESRLDNLVFRAGFARTRAQARQFVNHNHVIVDGHKANIPSMIIKPGSVIEIKASLENNANVKDALEVMTTAAWLTRENNKVTYTRLPERNEFAKEIDESLIVEYYNRR